MKPRPYLVETLFLIAVLAVAVAGFWDLYFGADADPNGFHHLHVVTSFGWLGLLLLQLRLMGTKRVALHRKVGLSVLFAGPLIVASTALLTVHSAAKGLASGRGDALIVQNVAVTLEIGLVLVLAFAVLRRPRLHGALLLSSAIFFMGIALFFALLSFAPPFRIEGPETFHRFGTAAATAQGVGIAVAVLLFLNDRRYGWPYLLVGGLIVVNGLVDSFLGRIGGTEPLTEVVGSWNPYVAFAVAFAVVLGILLATGVRRPRRPASALPSPRPAERSTSRPAIYDAP